MTEASEGLVTIGEFSRLSCITPRMLRYYDRLGILSPEVVDPYSGYRRYSLRQLDQALRVVRLRDLQVPTALMAELVRLEPDSERLRHALDEHRRQLVAQSEQIARSIAELTAWLSEAAAPDLLTVQRTVLPAHRVTSARGILPSYRDTDPLWEPLLARLGIDPADPPPGFGSGSVCHDEEYRETECDLEMWITAERLPGDGPAAEHDGIVLSTRTVPAQDVLQVTFCGDYIGNDGIYEAIGHELLTQGLRIAGPTQHRYHPGPPVVSDAERWVTDVAIPVAEAG